MDTRETVLGKQQILRETAKQVRVKLRMHDSEGSWLEGVLARGDRTLCDPIERAYRNGARFDCWEEELKLPLWVEAFDHYGIDTGKYLGTLPVTSKLPWDHISVGLDEGFLATEYRKALKNRLSPPCGKAVGNFVHHTNLEEHDADAKKLVCYHCGVACDLGDMRAERRDFLVELNAVVRKKPKLIPIEPVQVQDDVQVDDQGVVEVAEQGPAQTVMAEKIKAKNKRRQPTVQFDQGRPVKVRIAYTKLGRAAFRGHLDLVRLLPRIFRRLDIPMYYSQGFHPKPEMMFGPALPLGVASFAEYVDVKLIAGLDEQAIHERLTGAELEGIAFQDAVMLGQGDPPLSKVVDRADYVIGLPRASLEALKLGDEAALRAHVAARLAGPLTVVRDHKGIKKTIDIGQYLRSVEVGRGGEALTRAGMVGALVPVAITMHVPMSGGARISEVIEALLGAAETSARVVRTYMGMGEHSPLALEVLRTVSAPPESLERVAVAGE